MSAQAWGVIYGCATVIVATAGVVAWFVVRAFAKLDAVVDALHALRLEVVGNYVSKVDCREERAACPARGAVLEIASPAKRRQP